MSNDLISRQALIQQIAKEYDIQFGRYSLMELINNIQKEPTAYDVWKVIEELDKASDYYQCEEQGREHVQMIDLTKAIEIVRKGGIK